MFSSGAAVYVDVFAHYSSVPNTANRTTLSGSKNKAGFHNSDNGKYPSGRKRIVSAKPEGAFRLVARKLTVNPSIREADERFGCKPQIWTPAEAECSSNRVNVKKIHRQGGKPRSGALVAS